MNSKLIIRATKRSSQTINIVVYFNTAFILKLIKNIKFKRGTNFLKCICTFRCAATKEPNKRQDVRVVTHFNTQNCSSQLPF